MQESTVSLAEIKTEGKEKDEERIK